MTFFDLNLCFNKAHLYKILVFEVDTMKNNVVIGCIIEKMHIIIKIK